MPNTRLTATVSGSFHRHMVAIYEAVGELRAKNVTVLSPADPRVVDHLGEFLFVASDRVRSVKLVQDRHLDAIRASSFLWLVTPDGYVGPSAAMEVGCAVCAGVPIYSEHAPLDMTISKYVTLVPNIDQCVRMAASRSPADRAPTILIDPQGVAEETHREIERISATLQNRKTSDAEGKVLLERFSRHIDQAYGAFLDQRKPPVDGGVC